MRKGGEPTRLTASDAWHEAPSWAPDGSLIACQFTPGGFDEPRHGQIAVLDADTGERRILTAALDRNCVPYPPLREPIWDGETLLFSLEERGNTLLYRVRADGTGAAEPVVAGELMLTGYDAAGGQVVQTAATPTSPAELYSRSAAPDRSHAGVYRRARPRRARALHSRLGGRSRGRRLARATPGLRARTPLPGATEHSRRPIQPVRATASSTSSTSGRGPGTSSCTRTPAAPPGTARSGGGRSAALSTTAPAGAASTTRI